MAKRNKSDEIQPIHITARVPNLYAYEPGMLRTGEYIELLPDNLYKGLQPTLANDYLLWDGFYFLARPLSCNLRAFGSQRTALSG